MQPFRFAATTGAFRVSACWLQSPGSAGIAGAYPLHLPVAAQVVPECSGCFEVTVRGVVRILGVKIVIYSLLDACRYVLRDQGEPQRIYWPASQIEEMKLWPADEAKVRQALLAGLRRHSEASRFRDLEKDRWGLRSWELS